MLRFKTLGFKADSVIQENEKRFSFTYTHIVFSNRTECQNKDKVCDF